MCLDTTLATGLRDGSAIAHFLGRGVGLRQLLGGLGMRNAFTRCLGSRCMEIAASKRFLVRNAQKHHASWRDSILLPGTDTWHRNLKDSSHRRSAP